MGTLGPLKRVYRSYIGIIECILGSYRDNAKENGNYYKGFYRDNGKENGNYYNGLYRVLGFRILGF